MFLGYGGMVQLGSKETLPFPRRATFLCYATIFVSCNNYSCRATCFVSFKTNCVIRQLSCRATFAVSCNLSRVVHHFTCPATMFVSRNNVRVVQHCSWHAAIFMPCNVFRRLSVSSAILRNSKSFSIHHN